MNTIDKGKIGENIASNILKKSGYKIVERNWYCKHGELDIIAKYEGITVFIEVKIRTTYTPYKKIDKYKLQKLRKSINEYLKESEGDWRLEAFYIFSTSSGVKIMRATITKSY